MSLGHEVPGKTLDAAGQQFPALLPWVKDDEVVDPERDNFVNVEPTLLRQAHRLAPPGSKYLAFVHNRLLSVDIMISIGMVAVNDAYRGRTDTN